MKKLIAVMAMALCVPMGLAQKHDEPAKASDAPAPPPKLSYIETVAMQATYGQLQENDKQRQALMQQMRTMEAEIAIAHHGYHWDETAAALVENPKPEKEKAAK